MDKKLSDTIYEGIKEDIITRKLEGNTFLAEGEVAAKYRVSKAPVKVALQSLTQEGYLLCFPRKGYMVATVTVEEYESVRELRIHLEQLAIQLATERASDEEILSLREALCDTGHGVVTSVKSKTSNTRFHMRLAEISRNPYLVETLQKLMTITTRYAINITNDNKHHDNIIDALLRRDAEAAMEHLFLDLMADKNESARWRRAE